jgi:hypothetical protein
MSDQSPAQEATVASTEPTQEIEKTSKTYSQEEFDNHMAGLKSSLAKKYERQFSELGDINELKKLKADSEKKKTEEALKRGEFEKTLQELAQKKDAEIQKRDAVIKEYKVNTPLLDAAAKYKAVAPTQVQQLLASRVRLNADGDVEVLGADGTVQYDDKGKPLTPDMLVRTFLDENPHFVGATPTTTSTKSMVGNEGLKPETFDLKKLDLTRPDHRKQYQQAQRQGLV